MVWSYTSGWKSIGACTLRPRASSTWKSTSNTKGFDRESIRGGIIPIPSLPAPDTPAFASSTSRCPPGSQIRGLIRWFVIAFGIWRTGGEIKYSTCPSIFVENSNLAGCIVGPSKISQTGRYLAFDSFENLALAWPDAAEDVIRVYMPIWSWDMSLNLGCAPQRSSGRDQAGNGPLPSASSICR